MGLISRVSSRTYRERRFSIMSESLMASLPQLSIRAGPEDPEWTDRLMEEYTALIQYVENNKENDNDWFELGSDDTGIKWSGKCWFFQDLRKYEFNVEFEIPVTFPSTAPEIALPELEGKTAKMYRGGKICLTDHFKPLWARNVPGFGVAHAMALGLGPWLAVEVPDLISKNLVKHTDDQ